MLYSALVLNLLLLVSSASAGHYYGGSLTFTPKGTNPDGTIRVDFRIKQAYDEIWSNFVPYQCVSGNCGQESRQIYGKIDRSSNGKSYYQNTWCQNEAVITRNISGNVVFDMLDASCCWVPAVNYVSSWRLWTHVDLGKRSDTHKPNRSPLTTILPLIRVPQNCPRTYELMAFDPDGDQVRCRYATLQNKDCYRCDQPNGFHIDQNACTLNYDYTYNTGVYGFELVLEDFPRKHTTLTYSDGSTSYRCSLKGASNSTSAVYQQLTTTTPPHQHSDDPLSKIPLQFSFLVDPPAPSCTEGIYIPHFVSPTPRKREQFYATPLHELEIRVRATASHATVYDVIISGPLNITKHALSTGEYAIRWTPMKDDLGEHFPVCFIAESSFGSNIYQSEMRCVIVIVQHRSVDTNVICSGTNMAIEIDQLGNSVGIHKDYLRLNDPACTLNSNGTHVLANISINTCGTIIEEDEENIIFKNVIVSTDDPKSIITRRHEVEIEFSCHYKKNHTISLEFTARRHIITITERGFGTFTYDFGLFETVDYISMKDPNLYPVEYELGDMMYFQIESHSSINNIELFIDSCVATPYNDPNYNTSYTIIQNGCIMDDTVAFYMSHGPVVRFGLQAFKFIGLHDQVFISCSVIMCEANNPNTRCSQGCINSTAAPPAHHHVKREAPIQTASHFISQGPLRLKRSVKHEVSSTTLNLNLVFIAGCLLAAVGMVCGVLIYRTMRSKVKYQPLQSSGI